MVGDAAHLVGDLAHLALHGVDELGLEPADRAVGDLRRDEALHRAEHELLNAVQHARLRVGVEGVAEQLGELEVERRQRAGERTVLGVEETGEHAISSTAPVTRPRSATRAPRRSARSRRRRRSRPRPSAPAPPPGGTGRPRRPDRRTPQRSARPRRREARRPGRTRLRRSPRTRPPSLGRDVNIIGCALIAATLIPLVGFRPAAQRYRRGCMSAPSSG